MSLVLRIRGSSALSNLESSSLSIRGLWSRVGLLSHDLGRLSHGLGRGLLSRVRGLLSHGLGRELLSHVCRLLIRVRGLLNLGLLIRGRGRGLLGHGRRLLSLVTCKRLRRRLLVLPMSLKLSHKIFDLIFISTRKNLSK